MPDTIYTVYVGKYDTVGDSKKDQKKLNALGVSAFLFSLNGKYTLKVFTCYDQSKALQTCQTFRIKGFAAYIDTKPIKR